MLVDEPNYGGGNRCCGVGTGSRSQGCILREGRDTVEERRGGNGSVASRGGGRGSRVVLVDIVVFFERTCRDAGCCCFCCEETGVVDIRDVYRNGRGSGEIEVCRVWAPHNRLEKEKIRRFTEVSGEPLEVMEDGMIDMHGLVGVVGATHFVVERRNARPQ